MTPEEIKARVSDISKSSSDDEVAHQMEDSLHQDVLVAISKGECADPASCAGEAMKSRAVQFSRWCA